MSKKILPVLILSTLLSLTTLFESKDAHARTYEEGEIINVIASKSHVAIICSDKVRLNTILKHMDDTDENQFRQMFATYLTGENSRCAMLTKRVLVGQGYSSHDISRYEKNVKVTRVLSKSKNYYQVVVANSIKPWYVGILPQGNRNTEIIWDIYEKFVQQKYGSANSRPGVGDVLTMRTFKTHAWLLCRKKSQLRNLDRFLYSRDTEDLMTTLRPYLGKRQCYISPRLRPNPGIPRKVKIVSTVNKYKYFYRVYNVQYPSEYFYIIRVSTATEAGKMLYTLAR